MLGFIGLGNLGKTIANRLIECDRKLIVYNRTIEKAKGLNAQVADSIVEVSEKCEVIFICMFDSSGVRDILSSLNVNGKIIVDLTTNHFKDVKKFHKLVKGSGGVYLESPVLGSVAPAKAGALTILTSGEEEAYSRVKPILEDIGKNLFYFREESLATKMKLINNLALGNFMATIAEALSFGEDIGIDKEEVLDILAVGAGNSMVLNAKREKLLSEDFEPHFSNALIYKDLHCLQDLAYELKKPLFTGSSTKELFAKTYDEGLEDLDFSAIYKLFKK